jgi:4,5-dihydroxyphthalate decarboxylase
MLLDGELDALFSATVPPSVRSGADAVARLFREPRAVEEDYYTRTGIFPIMHTVVVRRELADRHPWVTVELRKVFEDAKAAYYERLSRSHNDPGCGLPFAHFEVEATQELFGADFWPYGVEANLPTLEAATRYSFEQGLSTRRVTVEELFAPASIDLSVE